MIVGEIIKEETQLIESQGSFDAKTYRNISSNNCAYYNESIIQNPTGHLNQSNQEITQNQFHTDDFPRS